MQHMSSAKIHDRYLPDATIVLYQGDVREFLPSVPDESVMLVVTSPPYNIGKEYESKKRLEDYLNEQRDVIEDLIRILSPEGSICWQVGNYVEDGEVYPLDIFYYFIFKEYGMKLRNRIIWHFGHGLHASKRYSGRYECILWFTKTDNYKFRLDRVRIPAKYPGKRHFKGPNKGKPSGNPLGKNPSDFWYFDFINNEWDKSVWEIPNVKSNHPEKTEHPCQFPVELVERCVLAHTDKGDWVLDPYCGVGSSLIAGIKHLRKVMGCEIDPRYVEITKVRIESYFNGSLRLRPMGKPVHQPTGREKVAQLPPEWENKDQLRLFQNK